MPLLGQSHGSLPAPNGQLRHHAARGALISPSQRWAKPEKAAEVAAPPNSEPCAMTDISASPHASTQTRGSVALKVNLYRCRRDTLHAWHLSGCLQGWCG